MSGTNQGGRTAAMSTLARSPSAAWMARELESLACKVPMMLSGLPRQSGTRVTAASSAAFTSSSGSSA